MFTCPLKVVKRKSHCILHCYPSRHVTAYHIRNVKEKVITSPSRMLHYWKCDWDIFTSQKAAIRQELIRCSQRRKLERKQKTEQYHIVTVILYRKNKLVLRNALIRVLELQTDKKYWVGTTFEVFTQKHTHTHLVWSVFWKRKWKWIIFLHLILSSAFSNLIPATFMSYFTVSINLFDKPNIDLLNYHY